VALIPAYRDAQADRGSGTSPTGVVAG
jgi:hypothetical protein